MPSLHYISDFCEFKSSEFPLPSSLVWSFICRCSGDASYLAPNLLGGYLAPQACLGGF